MNWIIIASILIPIVIAIVQAWFGSGEKEINWLKWVVTVLVLAGGITTYVLTRDDAREKEAAEKQITLLQGKLDNAKSDLNTIISEVRNVHTTLKSQGDIGQVMLSSIGRIENNLSELVGRISIVVPQAENETESTHDSANYIKVPFGDRNAHRIDSKSQISVVADTLDKQGRIWTYINGFNRRLKKGGVTYFTDENNKTKYIVYEGTFNNQHVFYTFYR